VTITASDSGGSVSGTLNVSAAAVLGSELARGAR
jgi:hypothetical protein